MPIKPQQIDAAALYSVPESCEALGVSRSTIYAYARAGRLRLVKSGARSRVPGEDLRRLSAGGEGAPGSSPEPGRP